MKKVFSAMIVAMAICSQSLAQTNTFPSSGNVGIGTLSPSTPLDVWNGAIHVVGYSNYNIDGAYIGWNFSGNGGETNFTNNIGGGNIGGFTFENTTRSSLTTRLMTILGNGNVGIGTTNPGALLTIGSATTRGTVLVAGGTDVPALSLGDSRTGGHQFTFYNGLATGSLDIYDQTAGAYRFGVNSLGNVGVATNTPVSLFQVDDGCTKASIGDASGGGLNYGTSYLGFNASRSGTSWLTSGDGGNNGGGAIYSSIFGDMYFSIVPTTGGSGQTLADANIANNIALKISHTDGAVYAKKIYVQLTGFPDYVFKKDYKLMPLAQVKSYIDANHHLPEMPTDKEVESKGLDVGEMNKLLTKKVEELTLYLIEKDKENKDLKTASMNQADLINKMELRLRALEDGVSKSK